MSGAADAWDTLGRPASELYLHLGPAICGSCYEVGPDVYFDDLFCMAADKAFVSAEKVVPTDDFWKEGDPQTVKIPRLHTTGVIEAPGIERQLGRCRREPSAKAPTPIV